MTSLMRMTAVTTLMAAGLWIAPTVTSGPGPMPPPRSDVVKYTGAAASLAERWSWAKEEAGRRGLGKGYWIGYSIEKTMGERSFIGSIYSDERRNRPSLGEILTGVEATDIPKYPEGEFGSMSGFVTYDDEKKGARSVRKEVGLLFHLPGTGTDEIDDMTVSNLSLRVDLEGDPLVWLGLAGTEESVTFLEAKLDDARSTDAKKEFIVAIGIHDESKKAIDILKKVLLGKGDPDIREDAAFWLGQTNNDDARQILIDVAWKDGSESIREKAIFSLSQMEGEAGTDAIIALARGHEVGETRKQAAFWLGQKASDKALGALKDIAYRDEDSEVQRSAMFALTQIENGGGVDELIKIARTHPNPKIRKDAIFWLGQSEDPRALDVLVEIVKGR